MEDLEKFRAEVREWLEANCPLSQRTPASHAAQYWGGRNATFASEDARLWFERVLSKGWTVPEWPREYGGAGLTGHVRLGIVPTAAQFLLQLFQPTPVGDARLDLGLADAETVADDAAS